MIALSIEKSMARSSALVSSSCAESMEVFDLTDIAVEVDSRGK
jgi:hypothetical protein